MRILIDRFPHTTIASGLAGAGVSKGAALQTANAVADLAYTTLGIVFLVLSLGVLIKKTFFSK